MHHPTPPLERKKKAVKQKRSTLCTTVHTYVARLKPSLRVSDVAAYDPISSSSLLTHPITLTISQQGVSVPRAAASGQEMEQNENGKSRCFWHKVSPSLVAGAHSLPEAAAESGDKKKERQR